MGEWSSYSLSDFILFSQATYYRQFELYNQSIWPLHGVAVLLVALLFYVLWKRPVWGGRVIGSVLVISWCASALFLYKWFYNIHVVANLYAIAFLMQAILLAWSGIVKNRFSIKPVNGFGTRVALGAFVVVAMLYPLLALFSERNWMQFEMIVLSPDPTALATLALLYLVRATYSFYVLPLLWLIISWVTQAVM